MLHTKFQASQPSGSEEEVILIFFYVFLLFKPKTGRVAQSVGHLTRKSEVLGSSPGLATYFRFSFR